LRFGIGSKFTSPPANAMNARRCRARGAVLADPEPEPGEPPSASTSRCSTKRSTRCGARNYFALNIPGTAISPNAPSDMQVVMTERLPPVASCSPTATSSSRSRGRTSR